MKTYVKQTFKDLRLPHGGVLDGATFDQCVFDTSTPTGGVGLYAVVRNVVARNCEYKGSPPFNTILEDVTIDGLDSGAALLVISDCLFKHVVVKGKLGKWRMHHGSPAQMDPKKFYRSVDWALDLRDAEFAEVELRGIPSELLRRDPATQVAVRQADARKIAGWEDLP
jgi:hypothetical protein